MSDLIKHDANEVERAVKPTQINPDDLPLPDEIAHLDSHEIESLERELTRRLDMSLMPSVFLLFLLNIL